MQPNSPDAQAAVINFKLTLHSPGHTLELQVPADVNLLQALDTTELRVRAACGGVGRCGTCAIQVVSGDFNPPTPAERQMLAAADLAAGFRLACQLKPASDGELYLRQPAQQSVWNRLDSQQLYQATSGNAAITEQVYGVAVDLGTTHIRLSLWNRQTGVRVGSRFCINPQVAQGADVLTRLDRQRQAEPGHTLIAQAARNALIDGLHDILRHDLKTTAILEQLGEVLIVGNTAMLTLIAGLSGDVLYDVENWQQPIACLPVDADAWRQAWQMPNASITLAQPLAGFVGSDLVADLLATGLTEQPGPKLLADFGTNTEIALWDGHRLWVTSVAGGPAFEGVGIRNGMMAEPGAVVRVRPVLGSWRLQTLGDLPARGFCASGFVDAMALLREQGKLKPAGRFSENHAQGGFWLDAENPRTAIYASDIDLFQRAKAATAAAMMQLLQLAGLSLSDLTALWICGSFGRDLHLKSAMQIGLLPTLDLDKIKLLANASLIGCEKWLLEPDATATVAAMKARARVINLGSLGDYEDRFIDHLRLQPVPLAE